MINSQSTAGEKKKKKTHENLENQLVTSRKIAIQVATVKNRNMQEKLGVRFLRLYENKRLASKHRNRREGNGYLGDCVSLLIIRIKPIPIFSKTNKRVT